MRGPGTASDCKHQSACDCSGPHMTRLYMTHPPLIRTHHAHDARGGAAYPTSVTESNGLNKAQAKSTSSMPTQHADTARRHSTPTQHGQDQSPSQEHIRFVIRPSKMCFPASSSMLLPSRFRISSTWLLASAFWQALAPERPRNDAACNWRPQGWGAGRRRGEEKDGNKEEKKTKKT